MLQPASFLKETLTLVFSCEVVPLVVIRCHYDLPVFLSTILGKHLQIRRRHLDVQHKKNALTKLKMLKENVESCFSKLNL